MKLDNDRVFCHPNLGVEPDSISCKSNGNNLDSGDFKSGNQKAKENENIVSFDSKSNERDLHLSTYDMKAGENLSASGLECCLSTDHLNIENKGARHFLAPEPPVAHSSQDLESIEKSLQQSPHPSQHKESFEKSSDIYMDKSIMECELPELIVCYKDCTYHVVKDICVDEGVPAHDKILFENDVDKKVVCTFLTPKKDQNKEQVEDNIAIDMPFSDALDISSENDSDKMSANQYQAKDLIQTGKDATNELANDVNKEMVLPENKVLMQELDSEPLKSLVDMDGGTEGGSVQISSEPALSSKAEEAESNSKETNFACCAIVSTAEEPNGCELVSNNNSLLENGSITFHFDSTATATCEREECGQVGDCEYVDSQNTSEPGDLRSDTHAIVGRVQHSLGESSFSAIGPLSSLINYSGPVAYSGSISLRSDSSTTSTRSFAFPVLQSEWNSSPVRMAKADRRYFRKHRGWRQGLLCCKF
ncbi:18S pre-ribosomal assembly protein gar2-related [Quillaja saponaria]|uniref:18S pre-ribosomal assembly protein gar2-related n=1 Tax=Quillaja saponaria TaxID=32244 RepID=A0AAD7KPP1_QUISA|nr:18S pre-ribosomal assembly protein gar2-related [Quillaja saponaria]